MFSTLNLFIDKPKFTTFYTILIQKLWMFFRYTTYYCAFISSPHLFGSVLLMMTIWALSIERFFALYKPTKFRQMVASMSYFYCATTFLVTFSIIFVMGSFYGIDNSVKPRSCIPNFIRIPALKPIVSYFYCIIGFLIVCSYSKIYIISNP